MLSGTGARRLYHWKQCWFFNDKIHYVCVGERRGGLQGSACLRQTRVCFHFLSLCPPSRLNPHHHQGERKILESRALFKWFGLFSLPTEDLDLNWFFSVHISIFMRSGTVVTISCSTKCQLPGRESPCGSARGTAACCLRRLGPGDLSPAAGNSLRSGVPGCRSRPLPVRRRTVGEQPLSYFLALGRTVQLRNKGAISSSLVDSLYWREVELLRDNLSLISTSPN